MTSRSQRATTRARARASGLALATVSAAMLVMIAGCSGGDASDRVTRDNGRRSDSFPNFELVSQDGEAVRFYDDLVKDRIVLVNFMYTTCDGV